MIIKVEIQLKMHAIFHPFKNKIHQNSEAVDLTWHNIGKVEFSTTLQLGYILFLKYFDSQHLLVVNVVHLPNYLTCQFI
jgi:hypothetical protein